VSLFLLALSLLACDAADLCAPQPGSVLTLQVSPPGQPLVDDTDPLTFTSIQEALDSSNGSPTTVCVGQGLYYEALRVPPGVHLLGEGSERVRIRPPNARHIPHPVFVDQALVSLEPDAQGAVRLEGLDIGGAALCVEALGAGRSTLSRVEIGDCGVGVLASAGSMSLSAVVVRDSWLWGVDASGLQSIQILGSSLFERNGASSRPAEDRPVFAGRWLRAPLLDEIEAGGALRLRDVEDAWIEEALFQDNWYADGLIVLEGGSTTLVDSALDLGPVEEGDERSLPGRGPAAVVADGSLVLERVAVRSDGQPLLRAQGSSTTVSISSSAWDGRGTFEERPGAPGPVIELDGVASFTGLHMTLLGQNGGPAIQTDAQASLEVVNSIAWGHASGQGLVTTDGSSTAGPGIRYSLFEDPSLTGVGMLPSSEPGLADTPAPWTPAQVSSVRCAGLAGEASSDLHHQPRPFPGEASPDLGAVQRQEACP